jgi:hypothetical protein
MKKLLLVSLVLLSGITSIAGEGKSYLSLRTSFSIAVGDYGKNDLDVGCFTTYGMSFGAEGAWFFWKNIGVGLDVNYSLHSVDAIALATEKVRVDQFVVDMRVRSEPYSILTIMSGFYYSLELTEKLSLQPKLMGGIMFGKTPFQLFEPTFFFLGPSYYKVTSSRDYGFALKTGLLIKYDLSNCIAIGVNADFTYSHLIFGFKTVGGNHEDRERKISYLDLGLQLIIKL